MSVRVYLAAGADGVRALRDTGEISAPAYAVTPAMRAADPRADEEDLEYEASLLAEESLRRNGSVVVVVAADVPDGMALAGGAGRGQNEGGDAVAVGPVPLRSVVSFHVAEQGADADEELLWYDVTELGDVVAYLGL